MTLPEEFFTAELSHPEFRLAISLYHLGGAVRPVETTMAELESLTGMGTESLRRALRGLEEHGLVATVRTKRNFGKFSINRYELVLPSLENEESYPAPSLENEVLSPKPPLESEGWLESPSLENEGSTAGQLVPGSYIANIRSIGKLTSKAKSTTYFLVNADGVHKEEDRMNKWNSQDDDSIGGFGLFEEEMDGGQPKPKADRRKASTRGQRPETEWTANDIASEFSFQMGRRFPYTPGLVNVAALRGALMKMRAKYGTSPDVEMELMRMFFEDETNLRDADANASRIHNRYLKLFATQLNRAYDRLGVEENRRVLNSEIEAVVDDGELVASDGRKFQRGIVGRKLLAEYEAKLKEKE